MTCTVGVRLSTQMGCCIVDGLSAEEFSLIG